jgi:pimeloyl-ACP methyl ester carboxylesterase
LGLKISLRRLIAFAILSLAVSPGSCNRGAPVSSQSKETPTLDGIHGRVTAHPPDAFYDPPPNPPHRPGVLLKSERFEDVTLPAGLRGWRIFYTTTVDDSTLATAVASVFAPIEPSRVPRPVIAWDHGTTGLLQKCMPSVFSFPTFEIPWCDRIAKAGWVVVATDYSFAEKGGPHPYLIGEGEARATLDAVRAARQMSELTLDKRMVAWGYSQGGHAALWTGIIGRCYAPELEILGVAAIAPATNIEKNLEMSIEVEKMFGPYIALAYSRFYPDVKFEQALRPEALVAARQIVNLCDSVPPEEEQRIEQLASSFEGAALATSSNKALRARLEQNAPNGLIRSPVVIAQGLADTVVPPALTDDYIAQRCSDGQQLEYWTFANRDHFTIGQRDSPLKDLLLEWTIARFANEPVAKGCDRKSF